MTFTGMLLVALLGLAGPILAWATRWRLPLLVGELAVGALVGPAVLGWITPSDPVFTLLADIGFTLTMFVAGSHVPVRSPELRPLLTRGLWRAALVGAAAAFAGAAIAWVFHTPHALVYTVILASSSAALVLPTIEQLRLQGSEVTALIAQVAIADVVSIVALPLVIEPERALTVATGAAVICVSAAVLTILLRMLARRGALSRLHDVSERHHLALELRLSLILLFAFAAVATQTLVSVMLGGFAAGLAVASVGEPRRLARQVFGLSDGFLTPLFYIWLGASLQLNALSADLSLIFLGLTLGLAALAVHAVVAFFRQPLPLSILAGGAIGVPVAAATIGIQTGALQGGEPAALLLGALVTIGGLIVAAPVAARRFRAQQA